MTNPKQTQQVFISDIIQNQININTYISTIRLQLSEISMQIFLLIPDGSRISLDVEPSYFIQKVRCMIYDRIGSPPSEQLLKFGIYNLKDGHTLSSYNIQNESLITLLFRLRGGGFQPIRFNNMEKPIIGFFSKEAPDWRTIFKGLNLQGICVNPKCYAFKKKVWIPKKFGKFNMTMEVYKSPCPICKEFCDNVENMGLFQAKCISKGRIKGESNEKRMESSQTKEGQFLTFEDKDETRVDWLYLEMEVLPL